MVSAHGTVFLGKVAALRDQYIKTQFMLWGIPVFPICSLFVLWRDGDRYSGIPLRLQWTSILATYYRLYGWIPMLMALIYSADKFDNPLIGFLVRHSPLPLLILWVCSFLVLGRVLGSRRQRCLVFGKVTGLFAEPETFPPEVCQRILTQLQPLFDCLGIADDPAAWKSHQPGPEMAPVIFVHAAYRRRVDKNAAWDEVIARVWPDARANYHDIRLGAGSDRQLRIELLSVQI